MAYLGKTPSQAVRSRYYFTASGGETSLAPAQVTGLSFTDANYVDVSLNGVALVSGTDYTATPSTNTISSLSALTASDVVEIVVYDTFSVFGGSVNGDFNISGGDLTLGDNDKAIFGAGSDLQIYHDSATNHSIITESGTGNLLLQADNLVLQKANGGNNYLKATANAQVDLYYNNAIKLATTSTGVDVTGVITTDGMTTSANINFGDDDKAVFGAGSDLQIYHNGTDSFIDETNASGWLYIRGNNTVIGKYTGETYFKGITDGAVELYHDNSKKFETTSTGVDVTGTVTADGLAVDGNASITASLPTFTITGQGRVNGFEIAGTSGNTKLTEKSNNGIEFGTNNTTRVTITSGGDVALGNSVANTVSNYNNQPGGGFVASDSHFEFATTSNRAPVEIGKNNANDGQLVVLRKQNTTVGSIGVNGGHPYIGKTNTGFIFNQANDQINPARADNGNTRDNVIDLGSSGARFDDIFATNGTIQTSDQQEKNTITDSDLGLDFINRLEPKSYVFNGKTRTHYGLIAQDVETVLGDISKPTSGFAGFIKSDISEEEDGSEYRYGLRYTEFVGPLIQAVKDLKAENDAMRARLTALENAE
jgi:hypothetical protein